MMVCIRAHLVIVLNELSLTLTCVLLIFTLHNEATMYKMAPQQYSATTNDLGVVLIHDMQYRLLNGCRVSLLFNVLPKPLVMFSRSLFSALK